MAYFTALGSARATERFDVTVLKVKDLQEGFKAGVNMNLSEILLSLKRG